MTLEPARALKTLLDGGPSPAFSDSGAPRPGAQTILLIHGTGGSAEGAFWALSPMLAMRHRVLAFTLKDPAADSASLLPYVEQAASVIRAAAPGQAVHVVGYSLGAVVAAKLAAANPDLVASLTLVAGWLKTDTQQLLRNDVWTQLQRENSPALAAFTVFTTYSHRFLAGKNAAELQDLLAAAADGEGRRVKMTLNRTVDIGEDLAAIRAPALVIGCRHDITAPIHHSRLLFGALENCRFAELDAGHGVVHERPAELFDMIDRFVRDPGDTPPGTIFHNGHA